MISLMERSNGGFLVELIYDGDELFISGTTEQHGDMVAIAPERARVAFEHPCTFLPTPERFFDRREAMSAEEYEEREDEDFREYGGESGDGFSEAV
jgi:hypothetical protein